MRLDGKVALITGAAVGIEGRTMGFGGAAGWMFTREGAKVVLTDVDTESGEATASQIRERGGDAMFLHHDVTKEDDWDRVVNRTIASHGKLDVLVNNAGTASAARLEDLTLEMWDEQMEVHAKGAFLGTKRVIPEMRRSGGGSIINVSSIYGIVGSYTSTAYHAAKGAVRLFTKSAAVQHAADGIRVNSIHPGFAMTPMTERSLRAGRQFLQRRIATVPMGRPGTADEIASGILFLASDESSYVTGAELVIDGGMTAA